MCVIIYKSQGTVLDLETLFDAYTMNPDGIGIAYRKDNRVFCEKGLSFDDLCMWAHGNRELLVHLRYATHGEVSDLMCHPFPVTTHEKSFDYDVFSFTEDILMHNGIISNYGDKYESDTLQFTRDCLAYIKGHANRVRLLKTLNSKFALMSPSKISLVGSFEDYQGAKWSNLYFLHRYSIADDISNVPLCDWDDEDLENFYRGYDYDVKSTNENRGNRVTNRGVFNSRGK